MEKNYLTNAMSFAKEIAIKKLKKGDIVVDATMGKGNDTLFLAKLIGDAGKIYSFDVQEFALDKTREKLKENNIESTVQLIQDGHENMDKYIREKVKLVMFNLGYLPGVSHEITTKADTTIKALEKALEILEANGVILIVIYHGHHNGKEEKECIEDFVSKLDQKEYNVLRVEFVNQVNYPPILMVIEKRWDKY